MNTTKLRFYVPLLDLERELDAIKNSPNQSRMDEYWPWKAHVLLQTDRNRLSELEIANALLHGKPIGGILDPESDALIATKFLSEEFVDLQYRFLSAGMTHFRDIYRVFYRTVEAHFNGRDAMLKTRLGLD